MAHQAWRWALVASVAIHCAMLAGPLLIGRLAGASELGRVDFWTGTTFEPSQVAEPGAAVTGGEDRDVDVEGDWSPSATAVPVEAAPTADPGNNEGEGAAPVKSSRAKAQRPRRGASAPSRAGDEAEASGDRPGGGTFGAEAAAAGTRDLVRSFVRALPTVASSDAVWATLPLGSAGSAEVALEVDGDSRPRLADGLGAGVPPHLRRLIQKTIVVLSGGRFAPTAQATTRASRVRVAIHLTQLRAPTDVERAAGGVFGLGFEGADAQQVSRAFFTLASGRHVEVTVKPLGH